MVGAINAVGFPSEMHIFADGPLPGGGGEGVWTLARRLETTESGELDVDEGAVALAVASGAELDCPAVASIEDLARVDADTVVQIGPDTAEVTRISCG